MRREIFSGKEGSGLLVAVCHLVVITALLIVLVLSSIFIYSCSGITFTDGDPLNGEGELKLSFGSGGLPVTKGGAASVPDSNLFILRIKNSSGTFVYNGLYGQRPEQLKLSAGTYDVSLRSGDFTAPAFDAPCYADSATVVIEGGKVTNISFLCRLSNGAVKLGFTPEFISRFAQYVTELEDSNGSKEYPYNETRYLYLSPGDIFIRLKRIASDGESNPERFLITRRVLDAREKLTVNLHSSGGGGGDDQNPADDSEVFTGILIDTSSVWVSEDVVVGERRDGSSRELAITVDEIAGFVGAKGIWVSGYVAGYLTTASLIYTPPFETETNIALSLVAGDRVRANCAGVALPAGEIRGALNLKANPEILGKRVYVKGTITESYFGLRGVNSVTEYAVD